VITVEAHRDEFAGEWKYDDEESHTRASAPWGYAKAAEGMHRDADEVWEKLDATLTDGYNLLLDVGPLPDGRLDPEDMETLKTVGERIKRQGLPG